MKLTLDIIKKITFGAEKVEEREGKFWFSRFTEAEFKFYEGMGNIPRYNRLFTTAGVRFSFKTNSSKLNFSYEFSPGGNPEGKFQFFDVYINGALSRHFGTESKDVKAGRVELKLGEGEKDIEVNFPWSANAVLSDVTVDDNAVIFPIKREKTMVCYGDSITHGYSAKYPSLSYAMRLARLLSADAINKGIGGDTFGVGMLAEKNGSPDYITVAYGTNDWACFTEDVIAERCRAFCERLSELYRESKIFVVTPIKRLDTDRESPSGKPVTCVAPIIKKVCVDLPNITVIDGWNLTPALPEFYIDSVVHPNDIGFGIYAMNLYKEIMKNL